MLSADNAGEETAITNARYFDETLTPAMVSYDTDNAVYVALEFSKDIPSVDQFVRIIAESINLGW